MNSFQSEIKSGNRSLLLLRRLLRSPLPAALLSIFLAAVAIAPRLANFQRPFWLDEADNNFIILKAGNFLQLREVMAYALQPILEYAARRYFWFPLFGHEEWGMRFPSLVAGSLTVFFCAFLAWRYLRGQNPALGLVAGLLLGLWAGRHTQEVFYSAEARQYTFTSFVSLLWFYSYFRLRNQAGWKRFVAASLVFLNTHFFALPLVGGAWGLESLRALFQRKWGRAARLIALLLLLLGGTVALNYPAFHGLFTHSLVQLPPEQRPSLALAWERARHDLLGLADYAEIPGGYIFAWAAILLLAGFFSREGAARRSSGKWLLFVGLILPLYFLRVRATSNYPFFSRYYMPFFGLAFFTPLLAIAHLDQCVARWKWIVPACLLAFTFWFEPFPKIERPIYPGQNFTPQFRFYESLKNSGEPVLVIARPCYLSSVPKLYWNYIGSRPRSAMEYPDGSPFEACKNLSLSGTAPGGKFLDGYFARNRQATVVLYLDEVDCPSLEDRSLSFGDTKGKCLVSRQNVRSAGEVRALASRIGFPTSGPAGAEQGKE